jgi:hypothetical protein
MEFSFSFFLFETYLLPAWPCGYSGWVTGWLTGESGFCSGLGQDFSLYYCVDTGCGAHPLYSRGGLASDKVA